VAGHRQVGSRDSDISGRFPDFDGVRERARQLGGA